MTKDDWVIMASEAGVLPVPPERVAFKGRLQPGPIFLVDMEQGRIVADEEIKSRIAAEKPYREWLNGNLVELAKVKDAADIPAPDHETVMQRKQAFGYTFQNQRMLMAPMARDGVEATGSMGTRVPLATGLGELLSNILLPPSDALCPSDMDA